MQAVINLYKPAGLTPLQAINKFREKYPKYQDTKLGVAGRLDPMAEGVMLVLVGEENKQKQKYIRLDKIYEVEILFGFQTDTYDALGIPTIAKGYKEIPPKSLKSKLKTILPRYRGKISQTYPPYSTKTVKGKSLWQWAREGLSDKVFAPEQEVEIFEIKVLGQNEILTSELKQAIIGRIKKVSGDFRQKQIINAWEKLFEENKNEQFGAVRIKVHCSSGTYMRSLAHELGEELGMGAIALNIKRTKIAKYSVKNSIII